MKIESNKKNVNQIGLLCSTEIVKLSFVFSKCSIILRCTFVDISGPLRHLFQSTQRPYFITKE